MIESIESSAYLPYIQLAMVAVFFFACYRVEEKQLHQSEQLNQEPELNEVGHHEIIKSVPSSLSMEQPKKYISVSSEKQEKGTIETAWYDAKTRRYYEE